LPPEPEDTSRRPALVIGEEVVVRGGRIALILAATVRDVAREVGELALVVQGARRASPARQLEAGVTDDSA
jgi:hypothetical protein